MRGGQVNRREFIGSVAAGASAAFVCAPAIAQGAAHVVIIGGGFAGATCARQLKRFDPKIQVTLVETNPTFTACPFSNAVVAGFRELNAQQFTYEKIAADGVTLAKARATAVEPRRARFLSRTVRRCPTIALYWRRASTLAGTRSPAITLHYGQASGEGEAKKLNTIVL